MKIAYEKINTERSASLQKVIKGNANFISRFALLFMLAPVLLIIAMASLVDYPETISIPAVIEPFPVLSGNSVTQDTNKADHEYAGKLLASGIDPRILQDGKVVQIDFDSSLKNSNSPVEGKLIHHSLFPDKGSREWYVSLPANGQLLKSRKNSYAFGMRIRVTIVDRRLTMLGKMIQHLRSDRKKIV